jgi:hypothetical protein
MVDLMNCIIIHGCPSDKEKALNPETRTYDKHWIPWTKRTLEEQGIKTETPMMPEPWAPDYEKFKQEFEKYEVNEDSVLIGHSCGTTFLVRWLADSKQKISKLILVSPWFVANGDDEPFKDYYVFEIDRSIKNNIDETIIFTSDNDYKDSRDSVVIINEAIGGKVIELPGRGHFMEGDMGTEEFPELIEEVINPID